MSESAGFEADLDVAVIGAGMSGLCMAIRLRSRGIERFEVFDKFPDLGGTWHDNTYPGAGCDVPSVLYSYSFAPNPDWSRKYSPHHEIKAYFENCAERFGIVPNLRLGAAVTRAQWQEHKGHWLLTLADGQTTTARALVSALGQLNRPLIPEFPGRDSFSGLSFHSARWDHDCDLTGKRVAVIGNAASALQFIPHVARQAAKLHVYQRSANYVLKRNDRAYSAREKSIFRRFPFTQKLLRLQQYLRLEFLMYPLLRRSSDRFLPIWRSQCSKYLETEIQNPDLRRALTPNYRMGCKRILVSDDYYGAFRRENVELITAPISGIGADGVISEDGIERPVDVIIYGTGFETSAMHSAVEYVGVDGQSLQDSWKAGAEAYRGVCVSGFPNFFMLYGPNTNLGSNSIIFMVERQVDYVLNCIDKLLTHKLRAFDVSAARQNRYNERMQKELADTVWVTDCKSWYKNAEGKVVNNWPRSTLYYRWHMRRPSYAEFDMRV
ncbi:MAG: NAD(P)/FAD-dependent oxidoreductase [Pseudomonadota bacterium]